MCLMVFLFFFNEHILTYKDISTSHFVLPFIHLGDNLLLDDLVLVSHIILPFPIDQIIDSSHVPKENEHNLMPLINL